jgi:hypothetical protein
MVMQTIKLSQLVLAISPELYDLLTEAERNAQILVQGELSAIRKEDMNQIIAQTIVHHHAHTLKH